MKLSVFYLDFDGGGKSRMSETLENAESVFGSDFVLQKLSKSQTLNTAQDFLQSIVSQSAQGQGALLFVNLAAEMTEDLLFGLKKGRDPSSDLMRLLDENNQTEKLMQRYMDASPIDFAITLANFFQQNPVAEVKGTSSLPAVNLAILLASSPRTIPADPFDSFFGIEDPVYINLPILKELFQLAKGIPSGKSDFVPECLLELPPSSWGRYSLTRQFFSKAYPISDTQRERFEFFGRSPAHDRYLFLQSNFSQPGEPSARCEQYQKTFLFTLGVCRQLARQSLEGRPFHCTVLLSTTKAIEEFERKCDKDGFGVEDAVCWVCLRRSDPVSTLPWQFRDHAELAQSDNLQLFVDVHTSLLRPIFVRRDRPEDLNRAMALRRLARMVKGVIVHVRGEGQVEVYDKDDLQLWFDGYRWHAEPFKLVKDELKKFFDETSKTPPPLTGRIIGAIQALFDRRASSIIACVKTSRLEQLRKGDVIRPMRRTVKVNNPMQLGTRPIKALPLDALVSLLQIDGAHVITNHGRLLALAQEVVPSDDGEALLSGTGRNAAKRLSRNMPCDEFVIKVSSSRKVHVFAGGREQYVY